MLTLPPSAKSPTNWSWVEGHSFKTLGLYFSVTWLEVSPVFTNGLLPRMSLFHYLIRALRLKSLNMHMYPRLSIFFKKRNSSSLPSVKD
jgi:hypothetical protein